MSMTLTRYQNNTLAAVKTYFERCAFESPEAAYKTVTAQGDTRLRLGADYGYKSPSGMIGDSILAFLPEALSANEISISGNDGKTFILKLDGNEMTRLKRRGYSDSDLQSAVCSFLV